MAFVASNPFPAPSLFDPCAIELPVAGSMIVAFPVLLLRRKDVPLPNDDANACPELASKLSRRSIADLGSPLDTIVQGLDFRDESPSDEAGRKRVVSEG